MEHTRHSQMGEKKESRVFRVLVSRSAPRRDASHVLYAAFWLVPLSLRSTTAIDISQAHDRFQYFRNHES